MRNILFILAACAPLLAPASAEERRPLKFDQPARTLPVKEPKFESSCAAYGAGFVKIAGTNTCVKIGGAVSIGGSIGR